MKPMSDEIGIVGAGKWFLIESFGHSQHHSKSSHSIVAILNQKPFTRPYVTNEGARLCPMK